MLPNRVNCILYKKTNTLLPISKTSCLQNEEECEIFLVKMSFIICMKIILKKNICHINGFSLTFALKQGLEELMIDLLLMVIILLLIPNVLRTDYIIFNYYLISNGNRTEWSPIRSVIIRVINKIGRPRSGSPICLITSMITDRIGQHEVLLPINHKFNKI